MRRFYQNVSIPYTDIPTDGTPYIIGQPHDYTGKVSDTMADKPEQTRFHVSAMGSNLTYQWYSYSPKTGKSGLLTDTEDPEVFMQIHGSNSDTLFITVHTDACFEPVGYYCIVSNENGSVQSRTAMERPHHVFNEHSEYVSLSDGTHARVCVGEGCEAHEAHPHPHEYDAWFVYRTATAEQTGIRRQVCKVCGETQDITIPKVEAGHAHAFNQYAAGPTKHWKECVCGLKQKGSEKAHVFDEWATTREPTELKAGQKTRRCKTCSYVEHADIEKLPHTHNFTDLRKTRSKDDKNKLLGAYDPPNGGFTDEHHFRYCTGCTSKHIEPHTFGEWHILHSPFTDKNGVSHKGTAYRRCTECGYEVQQQYAGKYPILTWVYNGSNANGYGGATIDGAVAADPGQKVTLNVKCAEGCTYDRGHVDVSGYHNGWSLYEVTSQEGIEMQGKWIAYQNYELEDFTADVFGTATFTMPDGPVALLFMVHDCDHKGYGTYADYIEPSCTGYGGDVLRCSECDKILEETKRVDPVGHQMVHDSTIQDGDCYHKSIEHHTCSKCGKEKKQAGEYHHDWVSLDNAYPNSCKSAGKETDWKCSLCGEIRYGERINPYGVHDFSEWETLIPATTRQKGLVVHECERCGQIEMRKTDYSGKDYRIAAQTSKINFSFHFGEEPEEQIVSIQSVGRDPVTVLLGATAKTTQYYTVKVLDDMRVSIKPNPVGIAMNGRASKDDVIEVMSASPGENGELATAMIAVSSQITYPSEKIHVSAEGAKISVYDETLKDFESRLRSSVDLSAGTILKITADNPESFKRWIAKDASGMVPALLRDFLMVDESTAYLAVPPCDLTLTAADSTLRSLNYTMDIPEANEKILSDDPQMGGPDGYEDTLNGVLQWKTVLEDGSYGDLTADCEAGKIYTLVCATDCGSDYEWEQDSDGNLLTKITLNGASPVKPVIRDGNAVLAEFAVMPQLAEKSVLLPGESCDISYPEKANGSDVKILGFEKCSGLSNLTLTDDGVGNIHITVPKNAVKGDYLYHVRMQIGDAEVVSAVPVTVSQTVQVRFDANGGFGTMEPDTAVLGRLYTLPACKFTAGSGLEFDCWNLGCPGDRIIVTEDVVLKAQWKQHVHNGRLIPASEPTCLLPGNVEYYYCEGCGKMFSDAECAMEAPTIDFFFIPATGHQMTLVPEKAASCAENGNKAYYICDNCGEWFADEAGIEPIGDHTAVLTAKLGHDWGKAVYSWSKDNSKVTAKRVCRTDASHVEEETADTVKTVQDPTYETAGSITYTAKFTNAAFAEQKKVIEIPKLTTTTTGITTTTTGKTTTTTTGKTTTTTGKTTTTTGKTTTTTTGVTTTTNGKTTTTTGKTTTTTSKTTTTTGKTTTTTGKTTTTTVTTTTQPSQPLKGDYNNDNEVNIADAVLLARFLAEDTAMTDGQIDGVLHAEPDYDSDGFVTLFDVYALLKKLGAS